MMVTDALRQCAPDVGKVCGPVSARTARSTSRSEPYASYAVAFSTCVPCSVRSGGAGEQQGIPSAFEHLVKSAA